MTGDGRNVESVILESSLEVQSGSNATGYTLAKKDRSRLHTPQTYRQPYICSTYCTEKYSLNNHMLNNDMCDERP